MYKQHLGKLALERFPHRQHQPRPSDETSPIPQMSHHVALMRQPELVVRYLEGPELPNSYVEYAGVFISDEAVDKIFADAEPPTHDDWISNFLENRRERTYINVALREIKTKLTEFVRPSATQTVPGELIPLGAFANQLGALLPGQTGNAAFSSLFARRRSIRSGYAAKGIDVKPPSNAPPSAEAETPKAADGVRPTARSFGSTDNPPYNPAPIFSSQGGFGSSGPAVEHETGFSPSSREFSGSGDGSSPENTRSVFDYHSITTDENLTGLLSNINAFSPSVPRRPGKVRINRLEEGELFLLDDGSPALLVEFELQFSGDPCTAVISANVGALLDDGEIETEPPEGSAVPEVLYWVEAQGQP